MSKFVDKIVEAVNNCGLNTRYIAEAAKINTSTVNRYRKGQFSKQLDRLERFLEVVGFRIELVKIPGREDIHRKARMFHLPPLSDDGE